MLVSYGFFSYEEAMINMQKSLTISEEHLKQQMVIPASFKIALLIFMIHSFWPIFQNEWGYLSLSLSLIQ